MENGSRLAVFGTSGMLCLALLGCVEHRTGNAVLRAVSAPTLIVHSREDKAVSFTAAEYAHAQIGGSELWEAPSWSHFIFVGHGADQVNRKIVEFLTESAG